MKDQKEKDQKDQVERCACGLPLHYKSLDAFLYIEEQIERAGPTVLVRLLCSSGSVRVPRHYIALHGLKAWELHTLAERYHWEVLDDAETPLLDPPY